MGRKNVFSAEWLEADMTWKIELAALAVTAAGVGGYLYKSDLFTEAPVEYHTEFTQADFDAFDRNFPVAGEMCEIGLKSAGLCLPEFDIGRDVLSGELFPQDIPALSAGMRVLLVLDTKEPDLQTVRVGQTLVLMERQSKRVA